MYITCHVVIECGGGPYTLHYLFPRLLYSILLSVVCIGKQRTGRGFYEKGDNTSVHKWILCSIDVDVSHIS